MCHMQEMTRKRRYGRLQKAMGDVSLLAGSPADAIEHYTTAIDLSKACGDVVWTGAAIAGVASAKVGLQTQNLSGAFSKCTHLHCSA